LSYATSTPMRICKIRLSDRSAVILAMR